MKVERGILMRMTTSLTLVVYMPMQRLYINYISLFEREYREDEKVLGIIIDNKYNLCHQFHLFKNKTVFGYIIENKLHENNVRVQLIKNFNPKTYDPYDCEYSLGEEIVLKKDEIKNFRTKVII